jgi:hypothetical protein
MSLLLAKQKTILLQIVNTIFDHGSVPDILKVGLLIPVFKNKGNIAEVINYRGITVLPVINKIIETIIKKFVVIWLSFVLQH